MAAHCLNKLHQGASVTAACSSPKPPHKHCDQAKMQSQDHSTKSVQHSSRSTPLHTPRYLCKLCMCSARSWSLRVHTHVAKLCLAAVDVCGVSQPLTLAAAQQASWPLTALLAAVRRRRSSLQHQVRSLGLSHFRLHQQSTERWRWQLHACVHVLDCTCGAVVCQQHSLAAVSRASGLGTPQQCVPASLLGLPATMAQTI